MSTTALPDLRAPAARRAPARSVFLPKEHGSWSLALEPIALGLLVAPSRAGAALGLAAVATFLARRPCKAMFTASGPRRRDARLAFFVFTALAFAALATALVLGRVEHFWPLLPAVPVAVAFGFLDRENQGRTTLAELAGAAAFAVLPVTAATLAGWSHPAALALGAVCLARSLPTILLVRGFLRARKGARRAPLLVTVLPAALAALVLAWLAFASLVPAIVAGFALLLLARAGLIASPLARRWSARRVGITEAVLGAVFVLTVFLAYRFA